MSNQRPTLAERISAAIDQDKWDNGTKRTTAAEILRGAAAHLEQLAKLRGE